MSAIQDDTISSPILDAQRPIPTGNLLVTLKEGMSGSEQSEILRRGTDRKPIVGGYSDLNADSEIPAGDTVLLEDIGLAIVSPGEGVSGAAMMETLSGEGDVIEARPEFYLFAVSETAETFTDTADRTWGIDATRALLSPNGGKGIKVAVLDTGLDRQHLDFRNRTVVFADFVTPNGDAMDRQGHGTHCAGTVCGTPALAGIPRYGVAPEVDLYVGKVLNDSGSGSERGILAGIRWAIDQGCHVISMSLGRTIRPGEAPSIFYERVGRRALDRGCLIVAAAGNDSARKAGFIAPVSEPANSPSIMAVAAVDQTLAVAYFSNGTVNGSGGAVDIAGPGVNVFSSVPTPRNYRTLGGTSMACPHVAGVAALLAASDSALRGQKLWDAVTWTARSLPLPSRDVGAGLVQSPGPATVGV